MKIPIGIVDDKSQNRLLFTERLNFSDDIMVVLTASNGKDFLDQMKAMDFQEHPAVILMDISTFWFYPCPRFALFSIIFNIEICLYFYKITQTHLF